MIHSHMYVAAETVFDVANFTAALCLVLFYAERMNPLDKIMRELPCPPTLYTLTTEFELGQSVNTRLITW